MKVLSLLLVVSLASYVVCQPSQLSYQRGQEFVFGMTSTVDARHADSVTLQPGGGSVAGMDSTVVYQCTDMDSESYLFVMNMFDTTVNVGQNSLSSQDTFKPDESTPVGLGDSNSLGYDMYFQQLKTGEIVKIWYNTGDSPYFVNVKAGAISAFQTRMVPANQQTFQYQETDLIGVHRSNFVGAKASDNSLNIAKSFNQKDFTSFATDPKLRASDLILDASQGVSVHPMGYIQSTSFNQKVLLVQTPPQQDASSQAKRDNNGFNMYMLSNGQMHINLQQIQTVSGPARTAASRFSPKVTFNFTALHNNRSYLSDQFHTYAAKASLFKTQNPHPLNVTEELAKIFTTQEAGARAFAQITRLIRYLQVHRSEINLVNNFLNKADVMSNQVLRDRLFYLLAALDGSDQLIQYGLSSTDREVRMHAILTAATLQSPSAALAGSLFSVAAGAEDSQTKHAALLAYGTVLKRLYGPEAKRGGQALVDLLAATPASDKVGIATILAAIKNAGPSVVAPSLIISKAVTIYRQEPSLRANVRRLLQEYMPQTADMVDAHLAAIVAGSDFPFNRTYAKDLLIGGRDVNLDIHGELFVGTNFDCNQKYFNYEGLAEVTGSVTLFTETANVFTAEAIYGADNGVHLADAITLVFLGQTLIDQPLPQVDCFEHTYNLFHSAPVLSASYVVWISVIPVVFSANAGVTLNVDWGWSICDSTLSALVELIPGATFSAQGDVELDLLIIRAGIELAAQVNTQIHPQAYIHGTQCEVGFDVERTNRPMDAYFESFFQTEKCTLWIFDCHWNDKDAQVWWQWSQPASTSILYNEDWKISL